MADTSTPMDPQIPSILGSTLMYVTDGLTDYKADFDQVATFVQGTNFPTLKVNAPVLDPSAVAQVDSTTQGALLPRMTNAQFDAIGAKAQGLLGYSTDGESVLMYNSTSAVRENLEPLNRFTTFIGKVTLAGNETVMIDDAGTLKNCTTQSIANLASTQREMFFDVQTNANYLSYRVRSLGSSGSFRFDFNTPSDFVTLVSVGLILAPTGGAAGAGKNVQITSDYGPIGGSTSLFGGFFPQVYDFGVADEWTELDISPAFLNIAPNQVCGFLWDHIGVGGTSYVEAIHLVYDTV